MQLKFFPCFLIAALCVTPAQSVRSDATDVTALRAEVQRLTLELLQYRAEFIQWKMHWIRTELQQVQTERQRLSSERRSIEQEIGELNLASTNNPGAEEEARKEELKSVQAPALMASERAATTREAALVAALNTEMARMAEIQKRLK